MPSDISSLLATLAQSSAAVVAIVGGFLVSRLVALSSEREGLRRQLAGAKSELKRVHADYKTAHDYRLSNSVNTFQGRVLEDVATGGGDTDWESVLSNNIPRGSSEDEMRPYLDHLIEDAEEVRTVIRNVLRASDTDRLNFDDLKDRGLDVPAESGDLYLEVFNDMVEKLPPATYSGRIGSLIQAPFMRVPYIAGEQTTSNRRLDESIREEQDLRGRKIALEASVAQLQDELKRIGRPAGVTSAIVILTIYSLAGIVAPVLVMAFAPAPVPAWLTATLVALFIVGLFAVLAYIAWYVRTLDDPVET